MTRYDTYYETYTPEEVAEVANVSRRTVYRWIASKQLPAHKVGPKMWAVYREVLAAFMGGEIPRRLENMATLIHGSRIHQARHTKKKPVLSPVASAAPVVPQKNAVEQAAPTLAPMVRNTNNQQKKKKTRR